MTLSEIPAPQRIAPHSAAISADVLLPGQEDAAATGRFVVLHDSSEPEPWHGPWRLVTYAAAQVEPEMGMDPLLGEVGWSWLRGTLEDSGLSVTALGGTVTRVISQSFGSIADREAGVELELRASWSPSGKDLAEHLKVWTDVLCTIAGLPPLPEGVVSLSGARR